MAADVINASELSRKNLVSLIYGNRKHVGITDFSY